LIHFYKRRDKMGEPEHQLGGTAIKPVGWDRTGWEALRYAIYDPDKGTLLSRTPMSWAKIIAFYWVYYTQLAIFWLVCLNIFFRTLPDAAPKWTLDESIIGSNPGVGIRPKNTDERIDSSMFYLNTTDDSQRMTTPTGEGDRNIDYARRAQLFMGQYEDTTGLVECNDDNPEKHGQCLFDLSVLGDCQSFPYGFVPVADGEELTVKPCIFLKLNKIFHWKPEPIPIRELDDEAYDGMSPGLKEIIRASSSSPDNIYFDCAGRYPADRDTVRFTFHPASQAIPAKYFPYTGGNYQSPVVALQVESAQRGQLLHLECRAWYKGVKHSTKHKDGLVQFEVMVN